VIKPVVSSSALETGFAPLELDASEAPSAADLPEAPIPSPQTAFYHTPIRFHSDELINARTIPV
jgi:hypothetical protein